MRYIDADKAIEEARLSYCKDCNSYNGVRCSACGFDDAMTYIEDTPTADVVSTKAFEQVKWERDTAIEQLESYGVGFCENKELVEVKHGEWIYTGSCQVCSICDEEQYGVDTGRFYCSHCGAKMDGERKHTKVGDT